MTAEIRLATPADAGRVRAIYAPHVRDSAVSFEREVPTVDEFERRIEGTLESLPWLVVERDGTVVGYAYAHTYRRREAYQWTAETTVYVDEDHRRAGVARGLYTSLFEVLRRQGYRTVFAAITLPNPASVGLHESMGFEPAGVLENVGYKDGAWHDVGWWALALEDYPADPAPLSSLRELESSGRLADAIDAGLSSLRPTERDA